MLEPRRPVERTPPSAFRPPHCPNPACDHHHPARRARFPWRRNGWYTRKCDRRRIRRYECKDCGIGFSQQTFAATYYMKRPELLLPVARWMTSSAPLRRICRSHEDTCDRPRRRPCYPSTVTRIARRIGAQCALILDEALQHLERLPGPVVLDHFETFVGMQENALGVLTPVDRDTGYTYLLEPAWHRQGTARSRRKPRVRPTPGAYRESVEAMLAALAPKVPPGGVLELVSDDHPAYPRAIASMRGRVRVRHRVVRNPPGRRKGEAPGAEARARDQAMFRVDTLHKWLRHVGEDHRREGLTFARRGEAALERLSAIVVARNFSQRSSERRDDRVTPAMRIGLSRRPWRWAEVLCRRRFPARVGVRPTTRAILRRSMPDPRGIAWPRHVRKRCF